MRIHSAYNPAMKSMAFFTSQPYSRSSYVYEQLTDQVAETTFNYPPSETDPIYFGITPLFVLYSMQGKFPNTLIIMMGCDGLKYTSMAQAFVEKGAKAYISWSDSVLASHTDQATLHLLQYLITQKQTIKQAIKNTMKNVGADPIYKSQLLFYPLDTGDYTIQNFISNIITAKLGELNVLEKYHKEEEIYGF